MATETSWHPYKIPAVPITAGKSWGNAAYHSSDPYVLSPISDANPSRNPTPQIGWDQLPIKDILNRISEIERRLDNASIEAECQGGTVTVTLNL